MKTETINFNDFMSGSYKNCGKNIKKAGRLAAATTLIPLAIAKPSFASASGDDGTFINTSSDFLFATNPASVEVAPSVPVNAKEWLGESTMETIAHALDPLVDILVALSFPVASVIIVGACFLFMFGNSEGAWSKIQGAALGYVLVNISPLILTILKDVGNSVV